MLREFGLLDAESSSMCSCPSPNNHLPFRKTHNHPLWNLQSLRPQPINRHLLFSLTLTHHFSTADVPSNPYSVRLSSVAQRVATVTFIKPDSHGGVPISHYLVKYKDISSHDWKDVKSQGTQSKYKSCFTSPFHQFLCKTAEWFVDYTIVSAYRLAFLLAFSVCSKGFSASIRMPCFWKILQTNLCGVLFECLCSNRF